MLKFNSFIEKRRYFNQRQVVYIFKSKNGMSKVGVTSNIRSRISQIRSGSGFEIEKMACSLPMLPQEARAIESIILNHFSSKKGIGEWLKIKYDLLFKYADSTTTMIGYDVSWLKSLGEFEFEEILEDFIRNNY